MHGLQRDPYRMAPRGVTEWWMMLLFRAFDPMIVGGVAAIFTETVPKRRCSFKDWPRPPIIFPMLMLPLRLLYSRKHYLFFITEKLTYLKRWVKCYLQDIGVTTETRWWVWKWPRMRDCPVISTKWAMTTGILRLNWSPTRTVVTRTISWTHFGENVAAEYMFSINYIPSKKYIYLN
jgi:hypothetical protein